MQYLVVLAYESDTERKRIDYAIERWKNETDIIKPKGTTIIFKGTNIDKFIEDLYSRIEIKTHKIEVFNLSKYSPDIDIQVNELVYRDIENIEFTQKFLEYIVNKLNARYEDADNRGKYYTVNTKKGQGRISLFIRSEKKCIKIKIEGYGEFSDFISKKIDDEMRVFLVR